MAGSAPGGTPSRIGRRDSHADRAAGNAGNAASRVDDLFQQQARERDVARREVLLHKIQQLTVDRVMFAPIMDFRTLRGVGPRVAEHALDTLPLVPYPAYEDMKLKTRSAANDGPSPCRSGYTQGMKTAVSLPDEVFRAAERHARRTRKSRSQLYAEALSEYLTRHAPAEVTEAMNQVVDQLKEPTDPFVTAAARRILKRSEW